MVQALSDAFKAACDAPTKSKIIIPKGTFPLSKITLAGPCKAPVEVEVLGTVQAPADTKSFVGLDSWITFSYMDGFTLSGTGTFDGQGASAWEVNNCHKSQECVKLPIVRFIKLQHINSSLY